MPVKNYFLAVTVAICFLSFQSCKKSDTPTPDPVPVIMPDTLTTGWTKQVIPGVTAIADIFFNSATNGYAVSSSGIFKSTDGGITWANTSSSINSHNIFMTNDNKAFFTDIDNDRLLKTIDGGINFTPTSLLTKAHDLFFTDNSNGFFLGYNGLYSTTDGGITWPKVVTTGLQFPGSVYSSLFCLNNTTGWVVTSIGIYKTVGSFANWQQATINGGYPSLYFAAVYASSATNVYVANFNGEIFKSVDGGVSFNFIKQLDDGGFTDIHFLTDLLGYASSRRHIYKTTDAGVNWSKVVSLGENTITEIHFTDATHGWACGSNGTVLIFKQ